MRNIRTGIVVMLMLLWCSVTAASAEVSGQVSIGIGLPNLRIGVNLSTYPELVPVPGYPVYYAPRVATNYFFYDGMYWVYRDDYWYASYWYNGPWSLVEPVYVPAYILRIPVRYYSYPPPHFRGWRPDAPPRWGQHWGRDWEKQRRGWDKWKRSSAPPRAPLPVYQRQYAADRYPHQVEQQQVLRNQHYRYEPRDRTVRQHFEQHGPPRGSEPGRRDMPGDPRMRAPGQQDAPRPQPQYQPSPQRGPAYPDQRQQPGAGQYERQPPRPESQEPRHQERGYPQEPRYQERGNPQEPHDRGHGQKKEEERGRGRD